MTTAALESFTLTPALARALALAREDVEAASAHVDRMLQSASTHGTWASAYAEAVVRRDTKSAVFVALNTVASVVAEALPETSLRLEIPYGHATGDLDRGIPQGLIFKETDARPGVWEAWEEADDGCFLWTVTAIPAARSAVCKRTPWTITCVPENALVAALEAAP